MIFVASFLLTYIVAISGYIAWTEIREWIKTRRLRTEAKQWLDEQETLAILYAATHPVDDPPNNFGWTNPRFHYAVMAARKGTDGH